MKKFILLFSILLIITNISNAQSNIRYDVDPAIENISEIHAEAWNKINAIDGYRIQIVSLSGSNSRKSAQTVIDEFSVNHPNISAYISYYEPNFRVRIGDYREKIDAARELSDIQREYPGAFIVKDKIKYRY